MFDLFDKLTTSWFWGVYTRKQYYKNGKLKS